MPSPRENLSKARVISPEDIAALRAEAKKRGMELPVPRLEMKKEAASPAETWKNDVQKLIASVDENARHIRQNIIPDQERRRDPIERTQFQGPKSSDADIAKNIQRYSEEVTLAETESIWLRFAAKNPTVTSAEGLRQLLDKDQADVAAEVRSAFDAKDEDRLQRARLRLRALSEIQQRLTPQ